MKKKHFIVIGLIVVLVVTTVALFRPMPIARQGHEYEIIYIRYNLEDVIDIVDTEAVINILRNYSARVALNDAFPSPIEDEVWEIGLRRVGRTHVIISLGNTNVVYRSAENTFVRRILEPESLLEELSELLY
jgi:hypothetical protein